ncbi:nuclear transcription factor Y subunit B-4-like [Salvia miltiorrhiza]|uniref:nuclear transcription factor Y subunit B-4-like n=1 Tax=Salvia miltiorrhiza TaxID=226208 RepID=UPI0025AC4C37|nr:nuclear transcription factor Y subunit B-4-like [Salvia miltiorrhiza]
MTDESDRLLPIANVGRIMKKILPTSAKISKEAKETMQECVSEFIGFVTSEASERCHKENRKTVNGDDICWALSSLGFDNYSDTMPRYLQRLREIERQRAKQQGERKMKEGCCQCTPSSPPSLHFLAILERDGGGERERESSSSSSAKTSQLDNNTCILRKN